MDDAVEVSRYSSSSDEYSYEESSDYDSSPEELKNERYFVTKEPEASRKESYSGIRDLSELDKIREKDIVAPDGSVRGVKNRVRAGLANFENRDALLKKRLEEGRIIVYVTSFRGVRSTFEDCRYVKTVMHNFLTKIEERDIYVNKSYYRELRDRLGEDRSRLPVPQVFISGQHIGGREKIEMLNETGELRRLLETFSRAETAQKCGYCGGFEFIPCRKCSGTKDSVKNNFTSEFKALRCTHCNENGLEPCPGCSKEGTDGGDMWSEGELKQWREREEHERQEEEDRRRKEKRERIKKEALEADFQKELKRDRELAERHRMKEEKKKKKVRDAAVMRRVMDDIEQEMEKEKQWKEERKRLDTDSSG